MSDEILTYIKETVDRIETKQDTHDIRIRHVENWQSNANGRVSTIGMFCGAIGAAFVGFIDYFRHP